MHSACIGEGLLVHGYVVLGSENMCRGGVAELWNRMASVPVHYDKVVPWTRPARRLRCFGSGRLRPAYTAENCAATE